MLTKADLIIVADAYKDAAGVAKDSTVSHRVFGDTKKLALLRGDADITLSRFHEAFAWFGANWPEGAARPDPLVEFESAVTAGEATSAA